MTVRLFLVAGEPSGDALGASLIRALRAETGGPLRLSGVGGPLMAAEGLTSLFPQDELAVMGLVEVLPRLPSILRRLDQTAAACIAERPDALVSIDSPSFGLRVARRVRARAPSIRTAHYVAPSVWAWRPGRAKRIAGFVDQLLALLPFEPPFFTVHGMRCDFVGHPAVATPRASRADALKLRADLAIPAHAPLLMALPGSRLGEVSRHADVFGETVGLLEAAKPGLRVVLPTVPGVADAVRRMTEGWPVRPDILDPRETDAETHRARVRAAREAATAALAVSGTVTLELAAARLPMVAAYRANPITAAIVRRIVRVDTANLVNLTIGRKVVPELLQERLTPQAAALTLKPLLSDGPERTAQLAAFEEACAALGAGGPPPETRAARALLDGLGRR